MNALLHFIASGFFGFLLGFVFFWGLWSTVKGFDQSRHPALRMMVSFLLRISIVIVGFYFVARYGDWLHVLIAVFGLILSRMFINQRIGHYSTRKESEQ